MCDFTCTVLYCSIRKSNEERRLRHFVLGLYALCLGLYIGFQYTTDPRYVIPASMFLVVVILGFFGLIIVVALRLRKVINASKSSRRYVYVLNTLF